MTLIQEKAPFMAKVFGNLIFQGTIAYVTAQRIIDSPRFSDHVAKNMLMYLILFFCTLIPLVFIKLKLPYKFALFTLLSFFMGVLTSRDLNAKEALTDAIGIFILMFVLGAITIKMGWNLRPIGLMLFGAILAMLFYSIFAKKKSKNFYKIGVGLMALFMVYDTNNILQSNYDGDFVDASFDYFTDIFNMASYLANIEEE